MAKSRALAHRSAPVIVLNAPRRGGRIRRVARGAGRVARRVGRGAKTHALPIMGLGVGGAIAGYVYGKGFLDQLPQIGGSRVNTLAIAGYAATRLSKNKTIRNAGAAAVAFAAFNFGYQQAGQPGITGDQPDEY